MDTKANILIVGGHASGKTVTVCSSYYRMISEGGAGKFRLVSMGDQAGQNIEQLGSMYQAMVKGEKLPPGTTESKIYEFSFNRSNRSICDIRWMDYRGALRLGEGTEEDREAFALMARNATVLIYIIPGNIISDYIHAHDPNYDWDNEKERLLASLRVDEEISQIDALLVQALKNREDLPPVLFYITKSDYIRNDSDDRKKMEALKDLIRSYNLFDFDGEEYQWKILGCHATLGRNLELDEGNHIVGGFAPEGFELPLMLTVGYRLSEAGKEWAQRECKILDEDIAALRLRQAQDSGKAASLDSRARFRSRFLNAFGRRTREQVEAEMIRENVKSMNLDIQKKEKTKASIEKKNTMGKYSMEILQYIAEKGENKVFYLNERGEERPLEEFFR